MVAQELKINTMRSRGEESERQRAGLIALKNIYVRQRIKAAARDWVVLSEPPGRLPRHEPLFPGSIDFAVEQTAHAIHPGTRRESNDDEPAHHQSPDAEQSVFAAIGDCRQNRQEGE